MIPKRGILIERSGEKMFPRNEHDDEIGGVGKLGPIAFGAERVDMGLHRRGVRREVRRLLALVDRAERILIGVQRHLGVDDEALSARYLQDRKSTRLNSSH